MIYSQGDSICDTDEEIEKRTTDFLIENNILKKDENEPNLNDDDEIMDEYMCSVEYEKYKYNVIEPYVNEERDKDYRYYFLFGGCDWYNPSFRITLARLFMPNIKWKIIKRYIHTTVVSEDETLVFCILTKLI